MTVFIRLYFYACLSLILFTCRVAANDIVSLPVSMAPRLIDELKHTPLVLPVAKSAEHFSVFKAIKGSNQYNHGAVLFGFKGKLYCQWQTSNQDEDGPETHVIYSISENGKVWQRPTMLAAERQDAIVTSGGWWSDGETLVAFINVWPTHLTPKAGHTQYALSKDGITWSAFKPVTDLAGKPVQGIIEQDMKATSTGRILTAFHRQPGLIATPYFTDHPLAISGWQAGKFNNLPFTGAISRELEPSWYQTLKGELVMTFRDQGGSYRILTANSPDNGETWSRPQISNIPDSRAKQSAGNLPDGTAYIVNNPSGTKTRLPLAITLSQDGVTFNRSMVLRDRESLPPMLYQGRYKRIGYSYPKSYVWRDALWISYAVNKEDIAITRLPLPLAN